MVTGKIFALLVEFLAGFRLGSATRGLPADGLPAGFLVASWILPEGCFAEGLATGCFVGFALFGWILAGAAFVLTLMGCLAFAWAEVLATGLPLASAFTADTLLAIGFVAATFALATGLDAGFAAAFGPIAFAGADLGAGFAAGFGAGLAVARALAGLLRDDCAMGRFAPACQRDTGA